MSTVPSVPLVVRQRFGDTSRRDAWWIQSVVVFLGLSAFVVYATWAAFQGEHYTFGPYLSPFYSPELFGRAGADQACRARAAPVHPGRPADRAEAQPERKPIRLSG